MRSSRWRQSSLKCSAKPRIWKKTWGDLLHRGRMDDQDDAGAEHDAGPPRDREGPQGGGAPPAQSSAAACLQAQMNLLQIQLRQVVELMQEFRKPEALGESAPQPSQAVHFDVYSEPSGGGAEGRSPSVERPRSRSPSGRQATRRSQRSKAYQ